MPEEPKSKEIKEKLVDENPKPTEIELILTPNEVKVLPEIKRNKTLPLNINPKPQESRLSEATPLTKSKENFPTDHPITRRASSPRFEKLKNTFEKNQEMTIQRRESSPVLYDRESAKKEIELEDDVVINYFTLFPEGSPASQLRKIKDNLKPLNAEKRLYQRINSKFSGS